MKALWTATEVAEATHGTASSEATITGVEIDSRAVKEGDLFIALKGPNHDAHEFVAQAFAKGAAAVLVHQPVKKLPQGACVITVKDTFRALEMLGHAARNRTKAKIVGVTGSVGKTSTRAMLAAAFSAHGKTHATAGNYNNHFGVPLTLARMPRDAGYGVIEMGMNHAGEIRALTQIARPHVALITTVEAVHLEFFSSVEAIADAKAEIFDGVVDGGVAVLNTDNRFYARLASKATAKGLRVMGFGQEKGSVVLQDMQMDGWGMNIWASVDGQALHYHLSNPGRHFAHNSLGVLAAVHALGLDVAPAAAALKDAPAVDGRGRPVTLNVEGKDCTLIDDSYNASPASVRAAIRLLAEAAPRGSRRILVLGDMLELGKDAPALHAQLAEDIVKAGIDRLHICGRLIRQAYDALPEPIRGVACTEMEELYTVLPRALKHGDWVLVKSSHGSGMWKLAKWLATHYAVKGNGGCNEAA